MGVAAVAAVAITPVVVVTMEMERVAEAVALGRVASLAALAIVLAILAPTLAAAIVAPARVWVVLYPGVERRVILLVSGSNR